MKHVLLVLAVAVAGALLAWALLAGERPTAAAAPSPLDGPVELVDQTARERIDALELEMRRLHSEIDTLRSRPNAQEARQPAAPISSAAPTTIADHDPRWYLEQYAASFQHGGSGLDYFRLVVDAFALELVDPIIALVVDATRPVALRTSLIAMLGTPRFRARRNVLDPLVGLVKREDEAAAASVRALAVVGDAPCGRSLEGLACGTRLRELRRAVCTTAVELAAPDGDRAILRLLPCATDEEDARYLLSLARGLDPEACLELFRGAWASELPVRLAAAQRIGDFRDEPLHQLTVAWLAKEPDAQVREHLAAAIEKQAQTPPYSAEQAIGPPDADLSRDSEMSWASQERDGGAEWIELSYSPPLRANGVRVFEGLSGGAIAEVHGLVGGSWSPLWVGRQEDSDPGECWITFATTARPVARIRLVLDTKRSPDWNEIDAVELVGPDGRGWATAASASSFWGE